MSRRIESLFLQLAPHAAVLGPILELVGQGQIEGAQSSRDIARLAGLAATRLPDVTAALVAAEASGAMKQVAGSWRFTLDPNDCHHLGLLLKGATLYQERLQDVDQVQVVLSKPPQPSRFSTELEGSLEGDWGLLGTSDVLGQMAHRATSRMSIMTPFVDADGAGRIVQLFGATRNGVVRELVVRDGMPPALLNVAGVLRKLEVRVFDFRLPRNDRGETETFHAKVVRIDDRECYVGSSNMTRWSFEYSLELGFHVTGHAASQVSRVLDAVIRVSNPVPMGSG